MYVCMYAKCEKKRKKEKKELRDSKNENLKKMDKLLVEYRTIEIEMFLIVGVELCYIC